MLVAHIAPVLVLSVTLNIPKFLESEVSKNVDDDDDDNDDDDDDHDDDDDDGVLGVHEGGGQLRLRAGGHQQ